MRKILGAVVVALSLLSTTAAANLVNSFYFIPVVTKAQGQGGTYWQTDISVSNLGTSTVKVGMKLFPANVANTFTGSFPVYFNVSPGQTTLLQDALTLYLNASPMPGVTLGYMILADITPVNCAVSSPPSAFPGLLAITARTYNTGDPKGTYSSASDMNLTAMNITTFPSVIPGVRHTGTTAPGYRTNLSVANFSTTRIKVLVKILNSAGALVVPESPQTVEALSFKQWSMSNFGVSTLGANPGRIEVRLDPTTVADPCTSATNTFCTNPCDTKNCPTKYALSSQPAFFAYASTTDNGTGDPLVLSSFIDWQGYNNWVTAYKNQHCPSADVYKNNPFVDWLRTRGLIDPEPAPMFRKVEDR